MSNNTIIGDSWQAPITMVPGGVGLGLEQPETAEDILRSLEQTNTQIVIVSMSDTTPLQQWNQRVDFFQKQKQRVETVLTANGNVNQQKRAEKVFKDAKQAFAVQLSEIVEKELQTGAQTPQYYRKSADELLLAVGKLNNLSPLSQERKIALQSEIEKVAEKSTQWSTLTKALRNALEQLKKESRQGYGAFSSTWANLAESVARAQKYIDGNELKGSEKDLTSAKNAVSDAKTLLFETLEASVQTLQKELESADDSTVYATATSLRKRFENVKDLLTSERVGDLEAKIAAAADAEALHNERVQQAFANAGTNKPKNSSLVAPVPVVPVAPSANVWTPLNIALAVIGSVVLLVIMVIFIVFLVQKKKQKSLAEPGDQPVQVSNDD